MGWKPQESRKTALILDKMNLLWDKVQYLNLISAIIKPLKKLWDPAEVIIFWDSVFQHGNKGAGTVVF